MENIKIRSESVNVKDSRNGNTSDRSLPRGEYLQNVIGPKLVKSPMQPLPISHRPVDNDDSAENSPVVIRSQRNASTTSTDSQFSFEEEATSAFSGISKSPSKFAKQQPTDILTKKLGEDSSYQKPPEKFYTPVIGKKKVDLYKLSIIQNASKFNEPESPIPETEVSLEETKNNSNDINRIRHALAESLKEQKSNVNEITRSKTDGQTNLRDLLNSEASSEVSSATSKNGTVTLSAKNLLFGSQIDEKTLQKHITLVIRGLNYSLKLLKGPPMSYIESRQIVLKELRKKTTKTLLLDLDETLITSCSRRDNPDKVLWPEGEKTQPIMIKIRPFAKEFLKRMKEHFEILVFTASCSAYAETVVRELDPEKKYISYILDRNFCLETKNGFYIKDLRIIKNRDLKNMIIVDNLVHSFGFQIDNGVPILEWTGDKNDVELKKLGDYLIEGKKYDDIREYNKEKLRLVEFASAKFEEVEDF